MPGKLDLEDGKGEPGDALERDLERLGEHFALGLEGQLVKRARITGQLSAELGQRPRSVPGDQQPPGDLGELVASCAVDRPVDPQSLVSGEDLLHEHGLAGRAGSKNVPQTLRVPGRVGEPVDVVYSHARNTFVAAELCNESVRPLEHGGILHPHADETVDVEKAAVISLL